MNRRQLLALAGSSAAAAILAACRPKIEPTVINTVRVEPVLRNYRMIPDLPSGLGLGINFNNVAAADRLAAQEMALANFYPRWWYNWWMYPVSNDPGMVPMLWPDWVAQESWLRRWADDMKAVGGDPYSKPWFFGNEPELNYPNLSPGQIVENMQEQVAALWQAGFRPNVMAPGTLISLKDGRTWLDEFAWWAKRLGFAYTPSVHIYVDNEVGLGQQWAWLKDHCARWNLREVVITECGAGPNKPIEAWRDILPSFYRLLDDKLLRGLSPFAAYPAEGYAFPGDPLWARWPGFSSFEGDVNILGQQWRTENHTRN